MGDADARALERGSASGDPDAAKALVAERVRTRTGFLVAWDAVFWSRTPWTACVSALGSDPSEPGRVQRLWALPVSSLADLFSLERKSGHRVHTWARDGAILIDLASGRGLKLAPGSGDAVHPADKPTWPVSGLDVTVTGLVKDACRTCGGRGEVRNEYCDTYTCDDCHGTGDASEPVKKAGEKASPESG